MVPNGAVPSTDSDLLTLVSLLHVNGLNRLVFGPRGIISNASIIIFKIQCKSSPLPLLHFRHMGDVHSQKTLSFERVVPDGVGQNVKLRS